VEVFRQLYSAQVTEDDFLQFMGTGEANFLGGVARKYSLSRFDVVDAKVIAPAAGGGGSRRHEGPRARGCAAR
jgi:hypothetical protein